MTGAEITVAGTAAETMAAVLEITEANTAQNRAMVERATDELDALLDDDFVLVHITGYNQPKGEWLDEIRTGSMEYHDISEQSVSVDIQGDTAILRARNLVDATIWGSRAVWRLSMTTRFARTDGEWRPMHSRAVTF